MTFEEKLGLLQRGMERRIRELPIYVEKLNAEADRVISIVDDYKNLVEQYKDDQAIRKELRKDERLIALVGSKRKLKDLLYHEDEFVKTIETGMDEFQRTYGNEEARFRLLAEEAEASLPDARNLLDLIVSNRYDRVTFESFIDLFLVPLLTDWKQFEEDLEAKENEKQPDEIDN